MKGNSESTDVIEKINSFLRANFPQISMHGGNAEIINYNEDEKTVQIRLSGACSGCGISPMTTQMIRNRLPDELDEVEKVTVSTGTGSDFSSLSDTLTGEETSDNSKHDAPF